MIVPGKIPCWKVPPVARGALFEAHKRFINNENQIAQDAFFVLKKENFLSQEQIQVKKF